MLILYIIQVVLDMYKNIWVCEQGEITMPIKTKYVSKKIIVFANKISNKWTNTFWKDDRI